ncbi:MAG TPA: Trm112 family protein [Gemmatimonadota bacterium]|nr:Trm112 family protein [Gemmatimonadota bacterium]
MNEPLLDEALLEILVCPKCRGELEYRPDESALLCHSCRLRYTIEDGIPVMLIDEAEPF